MPVTQIQSAADIAELKAVPSPADGATAYLRETGRAGVFVWRIGDFTSLSTADPYSFIYVPHATISIASGCWVRERENHDLNIEWGGARTCLKTDTAQVDLNTAVIQSALDLIKVTAVGAVWIPARFGNYCCRNLVYSGLTPLEIKGQGAGQGTYVAAGQNGSVLQYVWPGPEEPKNLRSPAGEFLVVETSSASAGVSLSGFSLQGVMLYTETQTAGQNGKGLVLRGVYGDVDISSVNITGFSTGFATDDNPSNQGGGSTRNGKFNVTDLHITRATIQRMDLKACASVNFTKCALVEEPEPGYLHDLHIGQGSNGGRSDDLIFNACQFIASHLNPAEYPNYNVKIDGAETLLVNFNDCVFEQSKIAGVFINLSSPSPFYTNVSLNDCHFNGHRGYFIDSLGSRTVVSNPGMGPQAATDKPMIRIRGASSGTTTPQIGGGVFGGNFAFVGTCAVEVNNAQGVVIANVTGGDYGGHGYPVVIFGEYAKECSAPGIMPVGSPITPPTFGCVDFGLVNSFSVMSGIQSGAKWQDGLNQGDGKWTNNTSPSVSPASGSFGSAYNGTLKFMRVGAVMRFNLDLSVLNVGTAAGYIRVTLPVASYAGWSAGGGRDVTGTVGGLTWSIPPNSNQLLITKAIDNSFPAVSGSTLVMSGEYPLT